MFSDFFNWLNQQPQGTASFLGTLAGSILGFIALLLGAMYNARLNRKRDDRLRDQDRASLATALYAELKQIRDGLIANAEMLKQPDFDPTSGGLYVRIPQVRLFPELVTNIGLLPPDAIRAVADAYANIDQYQHDLLLIDRAYKQGDGIQVTGKHASFVVKYNTIKAGAIEGALDQLAPLMK
jgi:hypothetical protein